MTARAMRALTLFAGFAWLAIASYGIGSAMIDVGDDWELTYMLFSLALLVGAALVVTVVARLTRESSRPGLRMVGLIVCSLGVVSSIVAWALPLWMTLLGLGFAMLAIASGPRERRAVALLAAGQLVGLVVMFAGIAAEVGRQDEWGDYPAAGGIAVVVTAALTVIALFKLRGGIERGPVTQGAGLAGVSSVE